MVNTGLLSTKAEDVGLYSRPAKSLLLLLFLKVNPNLSVAEDCLNIIRLSPTNVLTSVIFWAVFVVT